MEVYAADRQRARSKVLDEHVRAENRHDLEGILRTFGGRARYHDEAWSQHYVGRAGVREWYRALLSAVPDFHVEIVERHETEDVAILEVLVRGTQEGPLYGLPGTGRRFEVPAVAIYTFDETDRLAGERIYHDRATPLSQVGLFQDPRTRLGRVLTPLQHPITTTRALFRALLRRARRELRLEDGHGSPAFENPQTGAG
ncbi:MAG: ester cyclase [Gemmatimonadota bacterium]